MASERDRLLNWGLPQIENLLFIKTMRTDSGDFDILYRDPRTDGLLVWGANEGELEFRKRVKHERWLANVRELDGKSHPHRRVRV